MYLQIEVSRSSATAMEQLGTKRKFWFEDGENRCLFKAEERGTGEDWAEKIACELCKVLGIPHVHYELALEFDGDRPTHPGVVCETCAPEPTWLVLGNQLLKVFDESYPAQHIRNYRFSQHTVTAVAHALERIERPRSNWTHGCDLPLSMRSALDIFIGYVMLDALIANQDHHHENWGAIATGGPLALAPTFDHGASLARNLSDTERKDRLESNDKGRQIAHFATRARSAFFENISDNRALETVEAMRRFMSRATDTAVDLWLTRVEDLTDESISDILRQVPDNRMSNISKDFTLELIKSNRHRILETRP